MTTSSGNTRRILGTLVHRSAGLAFSKPTRLGSGAVQTPIQIEDRWYDYPDSMVDWINSSATLLRDVFALPVVAEHVSAARLIADAGGPNWSDVVWEYAQLPELERHWVLERLLVASNRLGEALHHGAVQWNWSWIWAEPSLIARGWPTVDVTRPDLLVGESGSTVAVVEIKTRGRDLNDNDAAAGDAAAARHDFDVRRQRLEATGLTVAPQLQLLTISTDPHAQTGWTWAFVE